MSQSKFRLVINIGLLLNFMSPSVVQSQTVPPHNDRDKAAKSAAKRHRLHSLARLKVIGIWVSQWKQDTVIFRKDGSFQHDKLKGKWKIDAVDATQIDADWGSKTPGPWGTEHFWLQKDVIIGIRGGFGNPRIQYRKVSIRM